MFERFTERSRRVVVLAQEEARMLNHNYIGTEHILLGLIHERDSLAARVIETLGVTQAAARAEIREMIGEGGSAPTGHIPFTPRAKKVLELSLREALDLKKDYIGTEHILLGLIRERDGVGAQILERLGASPGSVRQRVGELTGKEPDPADPAESDIPFAVSSWPRGSTSIRGEKLGEKLGEFRAMLASIDRRLSAIERHLGIADDSGRPPAAEEEPPTPPGESPAASGQHGPS